MTTGVTRRLIYSAASASVMAPASIATATDWMIAAKRTAVWTVAVVPALVDFHTPLRESGKLEMIQADTPEGLAVLRHSTAHLMASAVVKLFPDSSEPHRAGRGAGLLELLQLTAKHGHTLDDVVMQLARQPGALLLLRRQQAATELAGGGKEASLLDHDGRDESGSQGEANEGCGDEDPPELRCGC